MPNNPMAFPTSETLYGGMTLRDYFAGQALASGIAPMLGPEERAKFCYRVADKMLLERTEPDNG
jgi:hypothetical protein